MKEDERTKGILSTEKLSKLRKCGKTYGRNAKSALIVGNVIWHKEKRKEIVGEYFNHALERMMKKKEEN